MRAFCVVPTCIRSTVWKAVDLDTQEVVAIKDINKDHENMVSSYVDQHALALTNSFEVSPHRDAGDQDPQELQTQECYPTARRGHNSNT
jgi:hypothetical protein